MNKILIIALSLALISFGSVSQSYGQQAKSKRFIECSKKGGVTKKIKPYSLVRLVYQDSGKVKQIYGTLFIDSDSSFYIRYQKPGETDNNIVDSSRFRTRDILVICKTGSEKLSATTGTGLALVGCGISGAIYCILGGSTFLLLPAIVLTPAGCIVIASGYGKYSKFKGYSFAIKNK